MWSNDRGSLRKVFFSGWRRFRSQQPLAGAEGLVVEALLAHPEYQPLMEREDETLWADLEPNPFLHMSLHIALNEQLGIDRPPGIKAVFDRLRATSGDAHKAQHLMMECLAEVLWEAQSQGRMPDEEAYIRRLRDVARPSVDR
ncbi:MAG: DUF1841 family protein [Gammaproteobacteria bacterium]|nr:DUF1841 family protein [Gammaproteobacteria bacterium]